MVTFPPQAVLDIIRSTYTATLGTPCSIWRDATDLDDISTGDLIFVKNSMCGLNLTASGSSSPFINTLVAALSVKMPGTRNLSFAWNENIHTGNTIVESHVSGPNPSPPTGVPKYRVGKVNDDDPGRFGLQVTCELKKAQR